jgi:hypothetical protein
MNASKAICAIAQAQDDLTEILQAWERNNEIPAIAQFVEFIEENQRSLHKMKLQDAFWSNRRVQMAQVIDWLKRPQLADRFEKHFYRFARDPLGEKISGAVSQLEFLRAAGH